VILVHGRNSNRSGIDPPQGTDFGLAVAIDRLRANGEDGTLSPFVVSLPKG